MMERPTLMLMRLRTVSTQRKVVWLLMALKLRAVILTLVMMVRCTQSGEFLSFIVFNYRTYTLSRLIPTGQAETT